jgi:hypothetical protein
MPRYRILSLDGGGSWALLQVMALRELYSGATTGHQVLADFDLVAANSGGGITLGGLAENLTLDAILQQYLSAAQRKRFFVKMELFEDPLDLTLRSTIGVGAKYLASGKLQGLQEMLAGYGDTPLVQLPDRIRQSTGHSPHFLIIAFDFNRMRASVFRSDPCSRAASGAAPRAVTLAEAIHASSNAPVNYFDAPAEFGGHQYWDGAIAGCNNPVLAAVMEALANGWPAGQIDALSLGTGTVFLPFKTGAPDEDIYVVRHRVQSSLGYDLQALSGAILDDPPDAATYFAYIALGQPLPERGVVLGSANTNGGVVRMSPLIQPVRDNDAAPWRPPAGFSSEEFSALANLDMDAVEDAEVNLIRRLGSAWISGDFPNDPVRLNEETMRCEVGHARFADALAAWRHIASAGDAPLARVGS